MAELKSTIISGSLRVKGDLNVEGAIVQEEIKDLKIKDKLIELASGSTDTGSLDGGGIQFGEESLGVFIKYRKDKHELEIQPRILGSIEHAVSASHAAEVNWEGITGKVRYEGGKDVFIGPETDCTRSIDICLDRDLKVLGLQAPAGVLQNKDIIPSGSSLYEILSQMLQKKLYPSTASQASISQKVESSFSNGGTYEIYSLATSAKVTLSTVNGSYNCAPGESYEEIGVPAVSWSDYNFGELHWNGTEVSGGSVTDKVKSWSGLNLRMGLGTNTLKIDASTGYVSCSNLPLINTEDEYTPDRYKEGGAGALALVKSETKTATEKSITCVGVWPCFSNVSGTTLSDSPNTKCTIQRSATFELRVPSEVAAGKKFKFAYPDGFSVSEFKVKNLDGTWVDFKSTYNKDAGTLDKILLDGSTKTYHYLVTTGDDQGESSYRIILNKTMNS